MRRVVAVTKTIPLVLSYTGGFHSASTASIWSRPHKYTTQQCAQIYVKVQHNCATFIKLLRSEISLVAVLFPLKNNGCYFTQLQTIFLRSLWNDNVVDKLLFQRIGFHKDAIVRCLII